ncbi:LysR substrate-binding domain-containing protein [Roseomonas sp. 18066]|uniref:LysR family transcriptional regulator n=1 Tax=Roseomonas sp. 18066 TaxID=2681412 RepID=UPI00135BF290|nr:LysR substrate-binding domain-containing protein [Roseomonas sp. 18066]
MLTLRQIEVLRAVLQAGSLAGAARGLGIAQPTVTRIVRRMEDVLGLALFDRSGGRLHPTAEARRMLGEIDRAYDALRHAVDDAARRARLGAARFEVGVSPSLGRALVPQALAGLLRATPGLALRLDVLSVSQVGPYLTEGTGEVAVTLFPVQQAGIHSQRIGQGRLVALVPRGSPLADRPRLAPADFAGQPLAVFDPHSVHGRMIEGFLGDVTPGARHLVRFAESAAALAEAGIAVALIDAFSAMAIRGGQVAVRSTTTEARFDVYLHRVLDRLQARFLPDFEALLAEGILSVDREQPLP